MKKNILVLYNSLDEVTNGEKRDLIADVDNIKAANDVGAALTALGHEVTLFNVNCKTLKLLKKVKCDVIFNLLEGFDDVPGTFPQICSYVESLNIPVTGGTALSGMLTTDKARAKEIMVRNRIPTPNYQLYVTTEEPLKYNLRYPLMTKPNSTDASFGITQDSVVKNFNELKERVAYIKDTYRDATLVEEYIDGRELEAWGVRYKDQVLTFPILEGLFIPNPDRKWDICDYDHKWGAVGYCDEACPALLPEGVTDRINQVVIDAFNAFDLKGYARLDIRLSKDNIPYVVEINVNPGLSLSEGASNISAIAAKGFSYPQFIELLVEAALYEHEVKTSIESAFVKDSDLLKS